MFRSIIKIILILLAHSSKIFGDTVVDLSGEKYDPDCTDMNINKTQVIFSPNFGIGNYPQNKKCAWKITAITDNADLELKIDRFELQKVVPCGKYDYLMVYYQKAGEEGTNQYYVLESIEGYCGLLTNLNAFVVTAKTMLVKFVSDTRNLENFPGFNGTLSIKITKGPPKISILNLRIQSSPNFNGSINATAGDTVSVDCKSETLPPSSYILTQVVNGSSTSIDPSKIKKLPNGTINLVNVQMSDSGLYQCNATNSLGIDSQTFQLNVVEKCFCPKIIRASWYPYSPYINSTSPNGVLTPFGIFPTILKMFVDDVCGKCEKGYGPTQILWDPQQINRRKQLGDLNNDVDKLNNESNIYDVVFPLSNTQNLDTYRGLYCVPFLVYPGAALIVSKEDPSASSKAMLSAILRNWPILILVIVFTTLAGIVIWMLETYWNEKQFPRSFVSGIGEGFWWAFVSMTTVGYGDIAPVSIPGRLFAVVWILTGLILIAIFTGIITTALTINALNNDIMLYNSTLAALNNSEEYRMGVMSNGVMKNYTNVEAMLTAMRDKTVKGMLLDLSVAAFYLKNSSEFRVSKIFSSPESYCAVLGKDLNDKTIYTTFVQYLSNNSARILKVITDNSFNLSPPSSSAAQESASSLFYPKNPLFLRSFVTSSILLLFFFIFGVLFEYWYLQPRKRMIQAAKNLEIVQSPTIKENAKRARFLKEYLLWEVNEFYDRWSKTLTYLSKKHKLQQQAFLNRGAPGEKVHVPKPISRSTATLQMHNEDEVDGSSSNRSTSELCERIETKNL